MRRFRSCVRFGGDCQGFPVAPGGRRWPDPTRAIEFGIEHADQKFFPMMRRGLAGAKIPFNAGDLMQQPDHSARKPLGIRDTIASETSAQIAGLAHIEHASARPAKKINTRCGRHASEKLVTEPFHQRSGLRQEPELFRRLVFCNLCSAFSFSWRQSGHGCSPKVCQTVQASNKIKVSEFNCSFLLHNPAQTSYRAASSRCGILA